MRTKDNGVPYEMFKLAGIIFSKPSELIFDIKGSLKSDETYKFPEAGIIEFAVVADSTSTYTASNDLMSLTVTQYSNNRASGIFSGKIYTDDNNTSHLADIKGEFKNVQVVN